MKLFKIVRYESCIGLSFLPLGRYKLECWYCPRGYRIREHTHPNEDIKLCFLFGHNIRFHRRKNRHFIGESFCAQFKHIGKVFTINAGDAHWFEVSDWPLVFMNIERWKNGVKPTSASVDFNLVESKDNYVEK
jgi:hypothetical protein